MTMSAGVAEANSQDNAETLTKRADTLLYKAKHQATIEFVQTQISSIP